MISNNIYADVIEMEKYISRTDEFKKVYYPAINFNGRKIGLDYNDFVSEFYYNIDEARYQTNRMLLDEKFTDRLLKRLKQIELNKALDKTYEDFIKNWGV